MSHGYTLSELTKIEGTDRVADGAGIKKQMLYRLQSGQGGDSMFSVLRAVREVMAMIELSEDEAQRILAASDSALANQLLDIKKAFGALDLRATIVDTLDARETREAKTEPDPRGRPPWKRPR